MTIKITKDEPIDARVVGIHVEDQYKLKTHYKRAKDNPNGLYIGENNVHLTLFGLARTFENITQYEYAILRHILEIEYPNHEIQRVLNANMSTSNEETVGTEKLGILKTGSFELDGEVVLIDRL